MSLCLITGVAGFVGSTLAARLLAEGHTVAGIDCFTGYYARDIKERNLADLRNNPRFTLYERNLATDDLSDAVAGVDAVFHQAGQPGVLPSWGEMFDQYVINNIVATQRLLEALKGKPLQRFVFASSSTVYGETNDLPLRETSLPKPIVPYGVTKLAAEHLVGMYHFNFGLPAIVLRYFSVYGPRQRPDMALHKFINAIARGETIQIRGDGEQTREATYVDDIVEANVLAMNANASVLGGVYNIGGGESATLNQIIHRIEQVVEREAVTTHVPPQPGELLHQSADTARARAALGFAPRMPFRDGLRHQVEWQLGGAR